jgi:hypothetical protein
MFPPFVDTELYTIVHFHQSFVTLVGDETVLTPFSLVSCPLYMSLSPYPYVSIVFARTTKATVSDDYQFLFLLDIEKHSLTSIATSRLGLRDLHDSGSVRFAISPTDWS